MLADPHRSVVFRLVREVPDDVAWALTGSVGFALRGVPLDPDDVDLQTDEAGAYAIEAAFEDAVTDPVSFVDSGDVRSHLGALELDGVEVEVIGDIQRRDDDGEWVGPIDVADHTEYVSLDGRDVPVIALDSELEAYRRAGRHERVEFVEDHLDV